MKNDYHIIEKKEFREALKDRDIVWIGEIHGITENYAVYRAILPLLAASGFKRVLWEMSPDFSANSAYSRDGRINPHSVSFLAWLEEQAASGVIDPITLFGGIAHGTDIPNGDFETYLAKQVIAVVENRRSVIITGNYHMGSMSHKLDDAKSCLDITESSTGLRIAKIVIKYAGGTYYNYGVKELSQNMGTLPFGTITKTSEDSLFFIHAGLAHAALKSPTT